MLAYLGSVRFLRHFHATATVAWVVLVAPSLLWWGQSIKWVVFMSVWANVAGHWSGWQAARAEDAT